MRKKKKRFSNKASINARKSFKLNKLKTDPHCHYCNKIIETYEDATIDHKRPLSKNGLDRPKNWAFCCKDCNKRKGSKPYKAFINKKTKE
jgi:5-methylcytosine-specific restriction endonuclease McrA